MDNRLRMLLWILSLAVMPWHWWLVVSFADGLVGAVVYATVYWWLQRQWLTGEGAMYVR